MTDVENRKTCFVIAPIGDRGTDIRLRSNQVFDHIISPVVSKRSYEITRADKIPDPGMITHQIIERLIEDDLVIADLTGRNANVFYELAVRHATRRPTVIMIAEGEVIPFDVSQSRAIQFNYRDLDSVAECKAELDGQICSLEEKPDDVFSPVSTAIDLRTMRESGDPSAQRDARILSTIESLQADFNRLERHVDISMRDSFLRSRAQRRSDDQRRIIENAQLEHDTNVDRAMSDSHRERIRVSKSREAAIRERALEERRARIQQEQDIETDNEE